MAVGPRERQPKARAARLLRQLFAVLLLAAFAMPATPGVVAQRPAVESPVAKPAPPMRSEVALYTVPDLVGHRLDEARRVLGSEGFKYHDVSEDGTTNGVRVVTRTEPAANARGPLTRRPEVTVYHRAELSSRVPSILGSDCNRARQILEAAKFTLAHCDPGTVTHQRRSGEVNRQEPSAGAEASRYRTVAAWTEPRSADHESAPPGDGKRPPDGGNIVLPPQLSRVPSLVNLTCAAALERLRGLDARLECTAGNATGRVTPGRINEQQPAPGQLMPKDRRVSVATEPERGVPDLRGQSCAAAKGTLASAGLRLGACAPGKATRNYAPGQINAQSPAPGQPRSADRLVQVWTEGEPAVPELRGQSCASAQQILAGVGLQLGPCATGQASGRYASGKINEQTPAPGQPPPANRLVQAWTEREATVPDLRGLSCEQARSMLAQRKLVLASCERGKSDGATPSGQITAQQPSAGSVEPADRRLQAWIAPPRVQVPHVEGQSADAAGKRLAASTLQARLSGPSARMGARVAKQQPAAGTSVEEGTVVTLLMELVVPDVRGRSCTDAGRLAADHGFRGVDCVAKRVADSGHQAGLVFAQVPVAATALATPATIRVEIVAEALHTVPEVVDQTAANAEHRLSQAGLRAQFDVPGGADRRVVVAALPPAGSEVEADTVVALTTIALIEVPALSGKTCAEAEESLSQLGLNFVCQSRWPLPFLPPVVDAQEPASATVVRAGSAVTGRAMPGWRQGGAMLAALLAGTALLMPVSRVMSRPGRDAGRGSDPTPGAPPPPALALRGEPDAAPRITVRVAGTPLEWPALEVRGEPGTPRYFVNLSNGKDDNGPA